MSRFEAVNTHRVGRHFEDMAARWLEALGWRVVARNVRFSRKEVDLVIRRGGKRPQFWMFM